MSERKVLILSYTPSDSSMRLPLQMIQWLESDSRVTLIEIDYRINSTNSLKEFSTYYPALLKHNLEEFDVIVFVVDNGDSILIPESLVREIRESINVPSKQVDLVCISKAGLSEKQIAHQREVFNGYLIDVSMFPLNVKAFKDMWQMLTY